MKQRRQRAVVVHIEALDLSSVPVARHHAVTAAFTRELETLLAEAPPLEHPVRPGGTLLTPPLRVSPNAPPERLGAALACAVHAGLTGSGVAPGSRRR